MIENSENLTKIDSYVKVKLADPKQEQEKIK